MKLILPTQTLIAVIALHSRIAYRTYCEQRLTCGDDRDQIATATDDILLMLPWLLLRARSIVCRSKVSPRGGVGREKNGTLDGV